MSASFEPIKNLFEKSLGIPIELIDNFNSENKEMFIYFLNQLMESNETEEKCFDEYGIDITKFTFPLWNVLEGLFNLVYGEETKEVIFYYLTEIYNEKKQGVKWLNEKEDKVYVFKTPEDVWEYVNKFCKKINE